MTKIVIRIIDKFGLPGKTNKMYHGHYCEFCDSIFQDNSTLSKHLRLEHSHHFEDAVFAYFHLAVEISEENFQIGADFIKADVFGLD